MVESSALSASVHCWTRFRAGTWRVRVGRPFGRGPAILTVMDGSPYRRRLPLAVSSGMALRRLQFIARCGQWGLALVLLGWTVELFTDPPDPSVSAIPITVVGLAAVLGLTWPSPLPELRYDLGLRWLLRALLAQWVVLLLLTLGEVPAASVAFDVTQTLIPPLVALRIGALARQAGAALEWKRALWSVVFAVVAGVFGDLMTLPSLIGPSRAWLGLGAMLALSASFIVFLLASNGLPQQLTPLFDERLTRRGELERIEARWLVFNSGMSWVLLPDEPLQHFETAEAAQDFLSERGFEALVADSSPNTSDSDEAA